LLFFYKLSEILIFIFKFLIKYNFNNYNNYRLNKTAGKITANFPDNLELFMKVLNSTSESILYIIPDAELAIISTYKNI